MLHQGSPLYERLLDQVSTLPVIDCHEHMSGPDFMVRNREPIAWLCTGYLAGDLLSAGLEQRTAGLLLDEAVATEQKWPLFEPVWRRTQYSGYARVTLLAMEHAFGEPEMSLAALQRIRERLGERDEAFYWRLLDRENIRAIMLDALGWRAETVAAYLAGKKTFPERMRLMFPLRLFHVVAPSDEPSCHSWAGIQQVATWSGQDITSLDAFLEAVFIVLKTFQRRGAAGIKDQAAYFRSLQYEVTPKCDAERIFSRILNDPRTVLGWPDAKPLDDFLFHQYMRFAAELDMPVQIHTGTLAGILNRVSTANAGHLANVLELHQRVRFDLFHANWPYADDLLFFGKNYPNVRLDMCWAYMIDPVYSITFLRRAVTAIPHIKIHGFGGDHVDTPEYSVAHLHLARQCIAAALADLVAAHWLSEEEAVGVAADWLYNGPNEFFRLGCEPLALAAAERQVQGGLS